ncbi:MAG: thioredoxin [Candidatus Aureabacteria bacterium]|nr:thioredoxin [Candidatus Auribacterota bacterium]
MEKNVKDVNFENEILKSELPVLVDFWAPWCAPCRMIAPTVEEIAKEYDGRLKVCKINVDEAPQTSSDYGVMSIPTLAVFKNGKVVKKEIGALSKSQLESMVSQFV